MDFEKFKLDMIEKVNKEVHISGFDKSERVFSIMQKDMSLKVTKLVCEILEEYDKRKFQE